MTTRPSDYSSVNIVSREFKADPFPFYGACARSSQSAELNSRTRMPGWSPVTTMYSHFLKTAGLPKIEPRPLTPEQPGKQPWMPDFAKPLLRNMLDLDEPDHTRLRTLVHKAFTPSMVERLQDRIQNIADELLDAMQSRSSMDLVHDYALPIPLTVIVELLGIPSQDRHRFHRWSKAIVRTPTTFNMVRALPPIRAFMRYLRQLVRQLRTAPQEGLLTALAQVEEAGDRLSEDELLAMAFLLLIAGHETTVNLIASGMWRCCSIPIRWNYCVTTQH